MTDIESQDELSLSVVVPVLNELSRLSELVENLNQVGAEQVVVVDGGSDDGTFQWFEQNWQAVQGELVLLQALQGRANQMNDGAAVASGDMIVFLHADTKLPLTAKQEILAARKKQVLWGRFDVRFPNKTRMMSVIACFINLRSRITGIATGDQAIFVDAQLFKLINGFESIPLMEDVAISKQLKRHCHPFCSTLKVVTSDRRWLQNGIVKTVLQMWLYRLAFFFGVSTERLSRSYNNFR